MYRVRPYPEYPLEDGTILKYTLLESNEVTIIDYVGELPTRLAIPEEIDGFPVTDITDMAFMGTDSLREILLPKGLRRIGIRAFAGCVGLREFDFPDSIEDIDPGAFSGCTNLRSATLPAGLNRINKRTFFGCTSLVSVTLPSKVECIAAEAFRGCVNLREFVAPNLQRIGKHAFADCPALWTCRGGVGNEEFLNHYSSADGVMLGCKSEDDGLVVVDYLGELPEKFAIPDAIDGRSVVGIKELAFEGAPNLVEAEVPDTVTKIEDWAFANCPRLESLRFPESGIEFGNSVFTGCPGLVLRLAGAEGGEREEPLRHTLKLGEEATLTFEFNGVGLVATGYKGELPTEVEIPDAVDGRPVVEIGYGAFADSRSLLSVRLPGSVGVIGDFAFSNCYRLESAAIPTGVRVIGNKAFHRCYSLRKVVLPSTLTTLNESAFEGCANLESVEFAEGLVFIGVHAFLECTRLAAAALPTTLKTIKDGAFQRRLSLRSAPIPASVEELDSKAFAECPLLQPRLVPATVKRRGQDVFDLAAARRLYEFRRGSKPKR